MNLDDSWSAVAKARSERDEARLAHRQALFAVIDTQATLDAARRVADDDASRARVAELERERDAHEAQASERAKALDAANAAARTKLVDLFDATPQTLIEGLDDVIPFLLMPLRVETRFGQDDGRAVLRLRIFLDDISIAAHEKALTQGEADDGRVYWTDRIRANAEPDPAQAQRIATGAWNVLATRHGAYRASWITHATQPSNWSDALVDPNAATYGPVDTKPLAWTEAPRSFVMPDRFVVRLYAGGSFREVMGALIPDDLPLGPDPMQAEGVFTRDATTGRLSIDPSLAWLVDYRAALDVGMAVMVPLELPREANGFDRIVVVGLRLASSPRDAAALVTRMLEAQRYSQGVSVVPQGTPTNNTDSATSGLTTPSESINESLALELDTDALQPVPDHFAKSDGQRLSEALSVPLDVVRTFPAAKGADVAEALAMNRALWSGTLGDFAYDMLAPLMSAGTIERVRRFFGAYVAGRGLLPAIRIGKEPYGVLATSSLALWTWRQDETGDETDFWNALLTRMRSLAATWAQLANGVSYVGRTGDPFAMLLSVIGLQASSVEYYARKAISRDYLANYTRFRGTPQAYATGLWEQMQAAVAGNLRAAGLDPAVAFKLATLVFWREHDVLAGPVIDADPRVPFSESDGIRTFDGARNYIDWFRSAPLDEIRAQSFKDADGKPVPAPTALLYQLLRESYLAELARGGRSLVMTRVPAVFAELAPEPTIANVGTTKTFGSADVLNVDASRIGATAARITVGDYLVTGARAVYAGDPPAEVAGLADMNAALGRLAPLSTARLERLFAEHVDLCNYRLDAWIHGLFARRLLTLRERRQEGGELNIGAYGWLENVRPAPPRQALPAESLPPSLRNEATGPVFDDAANGGFVHAPSLTHAVTAAVLRNAYLTHAEPARADLMSVNLSSARVRSALDYLDGLRSGQELAALLGYQLERGLHEGHPGIELDAFVYVLRDRFPYTSNKLTEVPAGTSSEAMEARNVINGYDLLEHVRGRAYPYGIAGLPEDGAGSSSTAQAQAGAIRAEIDRLADAMDAIGDLMLSESVHQVVQGNYDRAKGALQSITEGTAPPDPQVVETPRSGRSLTFRFALPLDASATTGWDSPLSSRALANAPLNHWLASMLPAPDAIAWQVTQGADPPVAVSVATLHVEPIDVVLMAGDHLGDFSSELERFLVYDYRVAHGVPDAMATIIRTSDGVPPAGDPALVIDPRVAPAGKFALASLMPLLKALARLVTRSRPLDTRDFELPSESQARDPANPRGFDDGTPPLKDLADLKSRIETGYAALALARDALQSFLTATIAPLYDALVADPAHAVVGQWAIELPLLRSRMVDVCRVGVAEALPTAGLEPTFLAIDAVVSQARAAVDLVTKRLGAAREALDTKFTDPLPVDPAAAARVSAFRTDVLVQQYADAARQIFGASYNVLPLFRVHAESQAELGAALATPAMSDPLMLEEWLQSLVRVRDPAQAFGMLATYRDWTGAPPIALTALQLPVRAGDPWIGGAFGDALPTGEAVSVVLCASLGSASGLQCGLALDEWTELVPSSQETTGIAFHFNRPNAVPPQALLLAVAPRLTGAWKWNDLIAVIEETFERAKLRAVEPDAIMQTAYFQTLPAILSEFSSVDLRSTLYAQAASLATLAQKA